MDTTSVIQLICMVVIFGLSFLCVVLPLKLIVRDSYGRESSRTLSLCNCLSGGVFLGTCFLQLVPFIEDKFNEVFYYSGVSLQYTCPVTQVTVGLGFFLILLTEQSVRVCQAQYDERQHGVELVKVAVSPGDSASDEDSEEEIYSESHRMLKPSVKDEGDVVKDEGDMKTNDRITFEQKETKTDPTRKSDSSRANLDTQTTKINGNMNKNGHGHGHVHGAHGHSHLTDIIKDDFGLRCLLLLVALGIHSVFEGVALGIQDETFKFITLFVGVAIHEVLMAFAIGVSLSQQNLRVITVIKLCLVFSSAIPVGMGIGMAMKGLTSVAGQIASATVQGLTAGTFVYVTFLEILPAEINSRHNCLLKVLFMFLGFGIIGCLKFGIKDDNEMKLFYQPLQSQTG